MGYYPPPFNPNVGATTKSVIEELEKRIRILEERILLLEPSSDVPALAEAYKEYKLIERLTT